MERRGGIFVSMLLRYGTWECMSVVTFFWRCYYLTRFVNGLVRRHSRVGAVVSQDICDGQAAVAAFCAGAVALQDARMMISRGGMLAGISTRDKTASVTFCLGVSLVLLKEIDDWNGCDNILALPPPDEDDDGFVCRSILCVHGVAMCGRVS